MAGWCVLSRVVRLLPVLIAAGAATEIVTGLRFAGLRRPERVLGVAHGGSDGRNRAATFGWMPAGRRRSSAVPAPAACPAWPRQRAKSPQVAAGRPAARSALVRAVALGGQARSWRRRTTPLPKVRVSARRRGTLASLGGKRGLPRPRST